MWWGRGDTLMPASPVPRDCSHHLAGPAVTQGRACAPAGTLCASHLGDYTSDCPGATPREAPMSHLRASSGPGGHTWVNRPPMVLPGHVGQPPPPWCFRVGGPWDSVSSLGVRAQLGKRRISIDFPVISNNIIGRTYFGLP